MLGASSEILPILPRRRRETRPEDGLSSCENPSLVDSASHVEFVEPNGDGFSKSAQPILQHCAALHSAASGLVSRGVNWPAVLSVMSRRRTWKAASVERWPIVTIVVFGSRCF